MTRRQYITSLFALAALSTTLQAAPDETSAARAAAIGWIQKIDAANYSASWDSAATLFKAAVTAQDWEKAANSVRAPLGPVRRRAEISATPTRTLPGVPEGHYVVFQYETAFENKAIATETVTVVQDRDGSWRAAGYFIK
jgi:hypothetical protein